MYCLARKKKREEAGGSFPLMISQCKYDKGQLGIFNAERISTKIGTLRTALLKV